MVLSLDSNSGRTTESAILDMREGPNLKNLTCTSRACVSQAKQAEVVHLRSADIMLLKVMRMMTLELSIGHPQRKVEFVDISALATNVNLKTPFIEKHFVRLIPKTGLTTPKASSPVTTIS